MPRDQEHSDERSRAVRWTIDRLVDRFVVSPEHAAIAKGHQGKVRLILQLVADFCYTYQLEQPDEWSLRGLVEAIDEVIPRKAVAGKAFFAAIRPVVLAYIRWGVAHGIWGDRDMADELAYLAGARRGQTRRTKADQGMEREPDAPRTVRPTKRSGISTGNGKLFQLRISLTRIQPEIWRQVVVGDITLATLHGVIQYGMGWQNCHLHLYRTALGDFTDPRSGLTGEPGFEDVGDTCRVRLGDLMKAPGDRFDYEYDFGDSWHHVVLCEAISDPAPGAPYPPRPRCVAGARACPPEDAGGVSGYEDLLRVLADPQHEEHEHMVSWSMQPRNRPYDPEYWDRELANRLIPP